MATTYEPIATTTLGSDTNTVTFSSIPSTYTDIVLVSNEKGSSAQYPFLRFNNDATSTYSSTILTGSGSAAASARNSSTTSGFITYNATLSTSNFTFNCIVSIQNYSNTSTYKTYLSRANEAATGVDAVVGLWRSTAAINRIDVICASSALFSTGSTFTLYGIKAA